MGHTQAPIVEMLTAYQARQPVELCCPGHRGGAQTDAETRSLLGEGAFRLDVTQVPDIDDLLNPRGAIAEAQRLAADHWGALETHFLVNGTSSGLHAALLATCGEGDRVVVPRACHRSVVEGLILSGALPVWVDCPVDPILGCALPPAPAQMRAAAQGARAMVVTRPTYYGDVAALPWDADADPDGPIRVVDEAWGAHLGLHPDAPSGACRRGGDLVVNSTHKTCGALSGGSMLHVASSRVDAPRVAAAVRLLTTTSPYYGVLASLDGARRHLALHGRETMRAAIEAARAARTALSAIDGVDVAGPARAACFDGVEAFDEVRLVFSAARAGWSGRALADALRAAMNVEFELADARAVIAQVSGELDARRVEQIAPTVAAILGRCASPEPPFSGTLPCVAPVVSMSPRAAWRTAHERVPLSQARGRVAAEVICPYPPGVAIVSYGERITPEVSEALEALRGSRLRVQGCTDATLETVTVVR